MESKLAQVSVLFDQCIKLLNKYNRKDLISDIEQAKQRLTKRECAILVCGEFKRGKSSLINALLQKKGLCPVDIDITTAVVSLIRYSKEPKVIRHFGIVGGNKHEVVSFDKIQLYASGKEVSDTWMLEIESPIDRLKNGQLLIDTPGIGGLDQRHSFLTSYFIPKADVVLFVVDAQEPISNSEINFLHEKLVGNARELIIVLNKVDGADDEEKSVIDVKKKLKDTFDQEIPIVPVSSMLKLEYLDNGDKDDLVESNFSTLEDRISEAITRHSESVFAMSVHQATQVLETVLAPLIIQTEQFHKAKKSELNEMLQIYAKRKEEMNAVCGPTAEWRVLLGQEMQELKSDVNYQFQQNRIVLTDKTIKDIIKGDGLKATLQSVATKLELELSKVAENIDKLIDDKTNAICKVIVQKISTVDLKNENKGSKFSFAFDRSVKVDGPNALKLIAPLIRNTFYAAGILQVPVIGWIGSGFVFLDGIKSSFENAQDMHATAIRNAISADINKSILAMQKYFEQRIKQAETVLQDSVQAEAKRLQMRYKEVADALASLKKQSAEEQKAKEIIVKTQIKPIEQMLKYIDRFKTQVNN